MSSVRRVVEQQQPQIQKRIKQTQTRKVKKRGLNTVHGFLGVTVVGVFLLLVGQLYLDGEINQLHYDVERLKIEIQQKSVENEELYSKISELSTYSRAMEIAKENGLATYENAVYIGE